MYKYLEESSTACPFCKKNDSSRFLPRAMTCPAMCVDQVHYGAVLKSNLKVVGYPNGSYATIAVVSTFLPSPSNSLPLHRLRGSPSPLLQLSSPSSLFNREFAFTVVNALLFSKSAFPWPGGPVPAHPESGNDCNE